MHEIHKSKIVGDGDTKRKIDLFQNKEEIVEGMNICLESIAIIRDLLEGLELKVFLDSRSVKDQCAINYLVIGNQIGKLDDSLKSNRAMETAYGARNIIAHWYGTSKFQDSTMFNNLKTDLDFLEEGCRDIIEKADSGNFIIVENRKPKRRGLFGR